MNDRTKGGIYGLLVGNAVGVPYKLSDNIYMQSLPYIDILPPSNHKKAFQQIRVGTYSDEGALSLCSLYSLIQNNGLNTEHLMQQFHRWKTNGVFAVGGEVFDIPHQLALAIMNYEQEGNILECGKVNPEGKGDGTLMRMLPLAIFYRNIEAGEFIRKAHLQANITHSHPINGMCCAIYGLWARNILNKETNPFENAIQTMKENYNSKGQDLLQEILDFKDIKGTDYVIDSLMSAYKIVSNYDSFHDIIVEAVRLGNDTDTTSALAGGIAGLKYGYTGIPKVWLDLLRGKNIADKLYDKLVLLDIE